MIRNNSKFFELYIIGSPWHAILAAIHATKSSNRKLFIIKKVSDKSYLSIINILNLYKFNHVDFDISLFDRKSLFLKIILNRFHDLRCKVINSIDKKTRQSEISKIFIFNSSHPLEKIIVDYFVKTNTGVFLLEDGIVNYLGISHRQSFFIYQYVKKTLLRLIKNINIFFILNKDLINVDKVYLLLQNNYYNFENYLPYTRRDIFLIKKTLKYLNLKYSGLALNNFKDSNKKILILDQSLSEDGVLSIRTELKFYVEILTMLTSKGYIIDFLMHPRSSPNKAKKLARLLNKNINKNINFLLKMNIPSEALMVNKYYIYTIGFWSNSIIYMRYLFRAKTYTFMYYIFDSNPNLKKTKLYTIHRKLIEKFSNFYIDFREL